MQFFYLFPLRRPICSSIHWWGPHKQPLSGARPDSSSTRIPKCVSGFGPQFLYSPGFLSICFVRNNLFSWFPRFGRSVEIHPFSIILFQFLFVRRVLRPLETRIEHIRFWTAFGKFSEICTSWEKWAPFYKFLPFLIFRLKFCLQRKFRVRQKINPRN